MFLLALSFLAGILSVFAACVLPLLPVIVGGSLTTGGSRRRMYIIVLSLAISIVLFTLILKASTLFIDIPEAFWRYFSGIIIIALGIFTVYPNLWVSVPGINALNRSSNRLLSEGYQRGGTLGDVTMGVALGPVFASCSPTYFLILATVLPAQPILGFVYLVTYAIGLSLALLLIAILGERLTQRVGVSLSPDGYFFKSIGIILIVVGILIASGAMKKVETWFVERGLDATFIELKLLGADSERSSQSVSTDMTFVDPETKRFMYKAAPELVAPAGYLNTGNKPILIGQYRGDKVVLIDIWTYSCINCQRTLPYITKWYETYKQMGLEIVGVHTPEFAFEKNVKNVEKAIAQWGITYPVILDNEFKTWTAFGNQYWPRKYLIDIDGYIIYDHIGEGGYEETEAAIQRALAERAVRLGLIASSTSSVSGTVVAETPDRRVGSPEIYFGAWRNDLFGNGVAKQQGRQSLPLPKPMPLKKNVLYMYGEWDIAYEYAKNAAAGAEITFKYDAKNVYMVARADKPVRVEIYVDGVRTQAFDIQEDRLYDVVRGSEYAEHVLDIKILDSGLEIYTFTFG